MILLSINNKYILLNRLVVIKIKKKNNTTIELLYKDCFDRSFLASIKVWISLKIELVRGLKRNWDSPRKKRSNRTQKETKTTINRLSRNNFLTKKFLF